MQSAPLYWNNSIRCPQCNGRGYQLTAMGAHDSRRDRYKVVCSNCNGHGRISSCSADQEGGER